MNKVITRAHGTGGKSSHELIEQYFRKYLNNDLLSPHDAAELAWTDPNLLITTDCSVVEPIIFPGGNLGQLAITGGANDLLCRGAYPLFASIGFILEEGLELEKLEVITKSLAQQMNDLGIKLVCADTKVVAPRTQPGMMTNVTLFGKKINSSFKFTGIQAQDAILLTGPIGSHGLAILQARENLPFKTKFSSDCVALTPLLAPLIKNGFPISYMRDVTRGGLAGILHELARQFNLSFEIQESQIPILPEVAAGLNLLGLDPMELANEGVMLVSAPMSKAKELVHHLRLHPLGKMTSIVGQATPPQNNPVILKTKNGGRRQVAWPEALNLPRIC